ncbi:phosphopyruvate hydratase [Mycobacterium xenopi 4042]|uniref:Enolase n=1 Tax=Mycobacterium xenopi 4042 TaxID=1299334 RepID=X8AEG8_MYCXE|nr:phosphopyruvate hydratase [Mycobacterium xenopi 4042]
MPIIEQVGAREILDSRGNPTVEVEVALIDGTFARAAVPSGASTGEHEAVELRDGGDRYGGKGVKKAVQAVLDEIAPAVIGLNADEQRLVDQALVDLDGTPDKSRLGANAMLGVSLAVAKAAADAAELPLFRYIGGPNAHILPVPLMNILNGGAHADTAVDVQEFMVARSGAQLRRGSALGCRGIPRAQVGAQKAGLSTGLGDEGGFAPDVPGTKAALDLISLAIESTGLKYGADVALALDAAATEFFAEKTGYNFEKQTRTAAQMTEFYTELLDTYPLVSIEDPLAEDDWDGWAALTASIGDRVQIVGDDIFVTNPERIEEGIEKNVANALLVKVNQIGTLTETLDAVALAHHSGYRTMMSHRSGKPRTPPSPTWRWRSVAGRSKLAHRRAASVSPNTTSCYGSRRRSAMPPATPAIWRSPVRARNQVAGFNPMSEGKRHDSKRRSPASRPGRPATRLPTVGAKRRALLEAALSPGRSPRPCHNPSNIRSPRRPSSAPSSGWALPRGGRRCWLLWSAC